MSYAQSVLIRNDAKSHYCFLFLNFLGVTSGHFLKISYFRVCFVKLKNRCIKSEKIQASFLLRVEKIL